MQCYFDSTIGTFFVTVNWKHSWDDSSSFGFYMTSSSLRATVVDNYTWTRSSGTDRRKARATGTASEDAETCDCGTGYWSRYVGTSTRNSSKSCHYGTYDVRVSVSSPLSCLLRHTALLKGTSGVAIPRLDVDITAGRRPRTVPVPRHIGVTSSVSQRLVRRPCDTRPSLARPRVGSRRRLRPPVDEPQDVAPAPTAQPPGTRHVT